MTEQRYNGTIVSGRKDCKLANSDNIFDKDRRKMQSDINKEMKTRTDKSFASLKQTKQSAEDGGENVITLTRHDGTSEQVKFYNGSKGSKGDKGDKGDKGEVGMQGNSGVADASNKTLVNDAITGGETDFLSAEVGKLGILTYDCSKGGSVTHATLQDAINSVPTTFQKVGLTITYKSGNTIYRYTLKANAWSADPANWFSVEDKLSDLFNSFNDKLSYLLEVIMPRLEYKKAIGTDGSIINASQSYNSTFYVTDFVEIKAGQKFIIENGYAVKGTNIIAIYSKEDKSYIEGIEGLGKTMTAEYTAKSDVYVRIGNNNANNLGINCKTYMSFETTSKKSDIFKTEVVDVVEIQVGIVTHVGNKNLSFSKRSQDRMALVNVDGSNILRITPRGSNGCSFAMLNSYTPPTSSSEFPDYVNKVVFNVSAGKSVLFDVSKAKYLMFVSATDVNPNTLPVEVAYLVSNEKSLITENTNSLLYEPPYQNIKVTKGTYTESERFDIEGAERVTFNLFGFGTRASKFLDADGIVLKKWGYGDTEDWFKGETTVPKKAKYLVYRTKYTSLEAYIHVYYKKQMSAQKINDELSSIRELTANAGYHYLADAHGVTTSNEDNAEKLQALIDMVNKNGGGIIEIGCGTFTFKNSVTLKSNVGIMGQGIGNTILKMLDGGSTTNYALFNGDFIKNVFIRDIEINSTGTNTTGKHLFMRYIEDSYFTHIKSVDSRPTAIGIDFLNHVTITDNIIINGGRSGNVFGNACIGIGTGYDKWENEDFVISNNICINGGQRGIFVEDQSRFGGTKKMNAGYGQVICGNIVRGGYRGITVEAGKRINISGNTIYGTQIGMGVKVYADDCLFQGNLLVDNNTGIVIDELSATFVDNNNIAFIDNIIKGGTTGIHVKSDGIIRDLTIKNNVIKNYTNGCKITGGVKALVLQGNNDFSTAISYLLGGEFSNAIIKDNTFTVAPTKEGETSFSGSTQWVEQMN